MRRRLSVLSGPAIAACLVLPAWGMGGGGAAPLERSPAAWQPLVERGSGAGISESRLQHTTAHLAEAGVTTEAGAEVLGPAFRATQGGLPAESILDKIDEGVLKGADVEALLRTAEKRLQVLERAQVLLREGGFPDGENRGRGLLISAALALESGLPENVLAGALERGRDRPPGQVQPVVQAGEVLHLEGFDDESVAALMADCLERKLRRPEILRMLRFAQEQRAHGLSGAAVRQMLWARGGPGGAASSPGSGPGQAPGVGSPPGAAGRPGQGPPGDAGPPRGGHR